MDDGVLDLDHSGVRREVTALIAAYTGLDQAMVTPEMLLQEELGLDSIDALEMLAELERRTGEHLEGDEIADIDTVADVVDRVEQLLARTRR